MKIEKGRFRRRKLFYNYKLALGILQNDKTNTLGIKKN